MKPASNTKNVLVYSGRDCSNNVKQFKLFFRDQQRHLKAIDFSWQKKMSAFERAIGCRILLAWDAAGINLLQAFSAQTIETSLSVRGDYHRWLDGCLALLVEQHLLIKEGEAYRLREKREWLQQHVDRWRADVERLRRDDPLCYAINLIDHIMINFLAILDGRINAVHVLFGEHSSHWVEKVYKANPVLKRFNTLVVDVIEAHCRKLISQQPDVRLNVLEVGAGTGSVSDILAARLAGLAANVEYFSFTDISESFLVQARQRYQRNYAFVDYKKLDITASPMAQGFRRDSYDVILASNVLHATPNIAQTLRHSKSLLHRHGLLILNEINKTSPFAHITFGLLDGWWVFEDEHLRLPYSPALSASGWATMMRSEGFLSVSAISGDEDNGQSIIAGASDGIVRIIDDKDTAPLVKTSPSIMDREITAQKALTEKIAATVNTVDVRNKTRKFLTELIAHALKIPEDDIDQRATFTSYGVDSIVVVQLTSALKGAGINVDNGSFFEHFNIEKFAAYLLHEQRENLEKNFSLSLAQNVSAPPATVQRSVESRSAASTLESSEIQVGVDKDIAIIGLSGRYPDARNVMEFWKNLTQGKNCIREIPPDRWNWRDYYSEEKGVPGTIYSKWGGFVEDIDKFDPLLFSISPYEAERMDPQERKFLEVVYDCILDAGYTPESLSESRRVGIYVGVMNSNYPVGTSYWSIANRPSYTFDFKGPSLAVDTACSSSLTAIHLARESLLKGECEVALAGGVNLIVAPRHFKNLSDMLMLTDSASCKPFSNQADGFVAGEGVGAVLLKQLKKAERAGDHIYALLKASVVNAGGKTSGYTVPNPSAQAQVISAALKHAGLSAKEISYVEAHGTGTALGDPVEITALGKAYSSHTTVRQFCAIGSCKSNIGHCESAAGIAGLTKVLLQIKFRKLVPSLHVSKTNEAIDFPASPFYLQRELSDWILENGVKTRLAGLSSFGAGGANVHLIVGEYLSNMTRDAAPLPQAVIIPLSAMSAGQLVQQTENLVEDLQLLDNSHYRLVDIALTLQRGRQQFEHRLALVCHSVEELSAKLREFADGSTADELSQRFIFRGSAASSAGVKNLNVLEINRENMHTAESLAVMAKAWVTGVELDWAAVFSYPQARRISLSGYPFARERYWVRASEIGNIASTAAHSRHVLALQNISTFSEQIFRCELSADHVLLAQHQVAGLPTLPGMAYLELVRRCVAASMGKAKPSSSDSVWVCENITWMQPFTVDQGRRDIYIQLEEMDDSYVYKATSEHLLHSEGKVRQQTALTPAREISVADCLTRCGHSIEAAQLYQHYIQCGIQYGPAFRAIQEVYFAENLVVAKLSLAKDVFNYSEKSIVMITLLDAALQSSLALNAIDGRLSREKSGTWLPVAADRLRFNNNTLNTQDLQGDVWAIVEKTFGREKIQITLCAEDGRLYVQLDGLVARPLHSDQAAQQRSTQHHTDINTEKPAEALLTNEIQYREPENDKLMQGINLLSPRWQRCENKTAPDLITPDAQTLVFYSEKNAYKNLLQLFAQAKTIPVDGRQSIAFYQQTISAEVALRQIIFLTPPASADSVGDGAQVDEQDLGVIALFRLIKALADTQAKTRLNFIVFTQDTVALGQQESLAATHASVHGLMASAAKEFDCWQVKVIDIQGRDLQLFDQPLLQQTFLSPPGLRSGELLLWRPEGWYKRELLQVQMDVAETTSNSGYRQGGVYVVIGGAGGIGLAWSEYLLKHYAAQLIWIGRRPLNECIRNNIDALSQFGPTPQYIQADASDEQQLRQALAAIRLHHAQVNGLLHSGIVLRDGLLAHMDEAQFRSSLVAKVDVSVRMAQIFCEESLDFVLYFSSVNSFACPAGQSNYSAGCTFKDAFAEQMRRQWKCCVKVINWGYWGGTGIVSGETYQRKMAAAGVGSIQPEEAQTALEYLLTSPIEQLAMIKTTRRISFSGLSNVNTLRTAPACDSILMRQLARHAPDFNSLVAALTEDVAQTLPELEKVLSKVLACQLRELDIISGSWQALPVAMASVPERYRKWMAYSLEVLAQHGYLHLENQQLRASAAFNTLQKEHVWQQWQDSKAQMSTEPYWRAQIHLLDATLKNLPQILMAKLLATDVLFPNSSLSLVEGIYQDNPVSDTMNALAAKNIANYMRLRLKKGVGDKINILEIGAGTGATSKVILRHLAEFQQDIGSYCYTDISQAFLAHGEKAFAKQYRFTQFKLFNVEQDPASQGFAPGHFDIVIAANVLHATSDMLNTLTNAHALLKRHGLLVLNELVKNTLPMHLTFGLVDGWWVYTDTHMRIKGSPLLSSSSWHECLSRVGFSDFWRPLEQADSLGLQIMFASSNGLLKSNNSVDNTASPNQLKVLSPAAHVATPVASHPNENPVSMSVDGLLHRRTIMYLKSIIGEKLRIAESRLDEIKPLADFGLDSILIVQITKVLDEALGNIGSTLFFEYPTITDIAEQLIATRAEGLKQLLSIVPSSANESPGTVLPVAAEAEELAPPTGKDDIGDRRQGKQQKSESEKNHDTVGVAVIGMAGQYPQAENIEAFWDNLCQGKNCISEIPSNRWDWRQYFSTEQNAPNTMYSRWGGFIDGVDLFDPLFFKISPAEAEEIDPQERIFLQTAYASIEDAGYTPATLDEQQNVGVFVGAMNAYYSAGASLWSIANRVSFTLDFKGPSLAVDSACSSSLSAIHFAYESILSGGSAIAIAGGVNLIVNPAHYFRLSRMKMLSLSDKCKAFGDGADGFVASEGVGAVILKPLHSAIAAGDHIYAVIRGSMLNAGGKTNGYTVPSPQAQREVIAKAMQRAGIHPRQVSYIEAHGTGTSLGDPIEIHGLSMAYKELTQDRQFCAIGSVKSNIGHGESAAGIAGFTKLLLQFNYRTLVPTLHCDRMNTNIKFEQSPFYLQKELCDWQNSGAHVSPGQGRTPRIAGISSFGAGGANCHILLEEYSREGPDVNAPAPEQPVLVVLSAKAPQQLRQNAINLADFIERRQQQGSKAGADWSLRNVAYTLQVGRVAMDYRIGLVVDSFALLVQALRSYAEGNPPAHLLQGQLNEGASLHHLSADEDLYLTLNAWVTKQKYEKLLELWVMGCDVDWTRLIPHLYPQQARRISLPAYAFARERYWIAPSVDESVTAGNNQSDNGSNSNDKDAVYCFEELWQPKALPENTLAVSEFPATLICFISPEQAKEHLHHSLKEKIHPDVEFVFIAQGDSTLVPAHATAEHAAAQDKTRHVQLNKNRAEDYVEVFTLLANSCKPPCDILFLWPLEDKSIIDTPTSLVYLLQAVYTRRFQPRRIVLTGEYANELEFCHLDSWVAFERSLRRTLAGTQVFTVIKAAAPAAGGLDKTLTDWPAMLAAELRTQQNQSALYRPADDGQLGYTRCISVVRPMDTYIPSTKAHSLNVSSEGYYLISGGLGGLGYKFAQMLARDFYQAPGRAERKIKLVLNGRSSLNAQGRALLERLEQLGAEVFYLQADISDKHAIEKGLDAAEQRFGRLCGVIHASGINDNQDVMDKSAEDFARLLKPKIRGTLVLDQLLATRRPDFCCYFSSSSAILGDFGSCSYALANRFQNAYARYRASYSSGDARGCRTVAISWPLWRDGGMYIGDHEQSKFYLKSSGQRFLEQAEGESFFRHVLQNMVLNGYAQIMPLVGEQRALHRMLHVSEPMTVLPPVQTSLANASVSVDAPINHESENDKPLSDRVESDLSLLVSRIVKVPESRLLPNNNLADFGFDSISLSRLSTEIKNHFSAEPFVVDIKPTIIFSYPTIEKLTGYMLAEYAQQLEAFYSSANGFQPMPAAAVCTPVPAPKPKTQYPIQSPKVTDRKRPVADEPVAIIGMSGEFPQARNVEAMWEILAQGKDAVGEIPLERFDWREYYQEAPASSDVTAASSPTAINAKWLGSLVAVAEFDPLFFGISPLEAEMMDPRQRLLLQESWRALEDAAYGREHLRKNCVGMFVGVEEGDYHFLTKNKGSITSNHNAILAARLSYFMDLTGPNMAINTACSSGLVALHQACCSLRIGDCDTALVAAANLLLTPQPYIGMTGANMLSAQGRCLAFDQRADGMVPGEAVVALVLKPLYRAEADGDPIYAQILGSGTNYDGYTNGITAPSGASQVQLLQSVYKKCRINVEDINYIVAHGTGTKLGDPIEFNALCEVFKRVTKKEKYCAITSTKSNFGHTFSASGLLSIVSLVQAMRYEMIPASLHCEQENTLIEISGSPFFINKQNRPWRSQEGKLRIAATSAFGMSGTNAHVVLADYHPAQHQPLSSMRRSGLLAKYMLVLSAKTERALQLKVAQLLDCIERGRVNNDDLVTLSYTLLSGRQHFNHRLAFLVSSLQEFEVLRTQTGEGLKKTSAVVADNFKPDRDKQAQGDYLLRACSNAIHDRDIYVPALTELAELFCCGYEFDWHRLYGERFVPSRMHLPTYPFANKTYWVIRAATDGDVVNGEAQRGNTAPAVVSDKALISGERGIAELFQEVDVNTTDARFRLSLSGEEFFLRDHKVNTACVLPGVAYLEMVMAAIAKRQGESALKPSAGVLVEQVKWLRPFVFGDKNTTLTLALLGETNSYTGATQFYVGSAEGDITNPYCRGQIRTADTEAGDEPRLSLPVLLGQCRQGIMEHAQCNQYFHRAGLEYGPGFSALRRLYIGDNRVVAELALNPGVDASLNHYLLHPGMLDSALQASIGLLHTAAADNTGSSDPYVPFSLDRLVVLRACEANMWAVLEEDGASNASAVKKLNVSVFNNDGKLCVRLQGLMLMRLKQEKNTVSAPQAHAAKTGDSTKNNNITHCSDKVLHWLRPVWKSWSAPSGTGIQTETPVITGADTVLFTIGHCSTETLKALQQCFPDSLLLDVAELADIRAYTEALRPHNLQNVVIACTSDESSPASPSHAVLSVFRFTKALLNLGYGNKPIQVSVLTEQGGGAKGGDDLLLQPQHAGIHGLMASIGKEQPRWKVRQFDVDSFTQSLLTTRELLTAGADLPKTLLAYRQQQWWQQQLQAEVLSVGQSSPYRQGGIYVVLGGAGGLGCVWTEYMMEHYGARVIWLGRRTRNSLIEEKIARLAKIGPAPFYLSVDATDHQALARAYQEIRQRYGVINGILHSAVSLADKTLANLDEYAFAQVYAAKAVTCTNFVDVFAAEPLDFILFFSAMQSFIQGPGQSNYVAGSRFIDAFAGQLAQSAAMQGKATRVKTVNWGYWGGLGVVGGANYQQQMAAMGVASMEAHEAMSVLEQFMDSPLRQLGLMNLFKNTAQLNPDLARVLGLAALTLEAVPVNAEVVTAKKPATQATVNDTPSQAQIKQVLRRCLGEVLKVEDADIRDELSFAEFGVDSILAVNLVNSINDALGLTLHTTVVFDYNNIASLCAYVWNEHAAGLAIAGNRSALAAPPSPLLKASARVFEPEASIQGGNGGECYRRVFLERPGTIDNIRILESPRTALQRAQVRLAVRAFSLNFGDLLCVKGLYPTMPPYPFTPGVEACGQIIEVGSGVDASWLGREVIAFTGTTMGGQASELVCGLDQVFEKPQAFSHRDICSLSSGAITIMEVFRRAQPQAGESILIQAATSATGLVAIQLAKHYGATVYATASTQEKMEYLRTLGVDHVINYQTTDFEAEIKRLTNGQGVDVVINTLSGEAIQKGINVLSKKGRYMEIAMTALKLARSIDLSALSSNQAIHCIDLRKLGLDDPYAVSHHWAALLELLEERVILPRSNASFTMNHIQDAYRFLESRQSIGRIVITVPLEEASAPADPGEADTPADLPTSPVSDAVKHAAAQNAHSAAQASTYAGACAVIGLSCRFADSPDYHVLWENLVHGRDLVRKASRWDLTRYFSSGAQTDSFYTPSRCQCGSFLEDIDKFDADFFNISGVEATYMDPQQRLFLQECWSALEDAGYGGEGIGGSRCGVYVGCTTTDYQQIFHELPPAQAFWGNATSVLASRIAYHLDLKGPAVAIDTACSSSLVAVHNACQSLACGEISMALAGGVSVQVTPGLYISANNAGMLSTRGNSRSFDAGADGFVPGEGVGVVVLKRLDDALADRDFIYSVIRGTGINQDGRTNGITAPSALSQQALEMQVYESCEVNPESIQFVEAHGTGTILGDPIEHRALTAAFRHYTDKKQYCALGSIKSNLGHALTAAGIAGLIKVVLALKNRQIPPSLHFNRPNPNIDFANSPFFVNTAALDWQAGANASTGQYPRRAAISSFGFSGTNVHMVVEEAPHTDKAIEPPALPAYLLVLSAKTPTLLQRYALKLLEHCRTGPASTSERHLADIAYTLLLGRKHFNHRLALVVRDAAELVQTLERYCQGKPAAVFVADTEVSTVATSRAVLSFAGECLQRCRVNAGNNASMRTIDSEHYVEGLEGLAEFFTQGYELDFGQLYRDSQFARLPLPTYPFDKERYWVEQREGYYANVYGDTIFASSKKVESVEKLPVNERVHNEAVLSDYSAVAEHLKQSLAELLKTPVEKISAKKDLMQYGADSIQLMSFVNKIKYLYNIPLSLGEVREKRNISQLAEYIFTINGHAEKAAPPEPQPGSFDEKGPLLLASGQQSIWLIQQSYPRSAAYNVPIALKFSGDLDTALLQQAINSVSYHHACLLSKFNLVDNQVVCTVDFDLTIILEQEVLDQENATRENVDVGDALEQALREKVAKPFDLENGPLLRAYYMSADGDQRILLLVLHHIVFDGSSTLIFVKDILNSYLTLKNGRQLDLSAERYTYQDFVRWQRDMLEKPEGKAHQDYWKKYLADVEPVKIPVKAVKEAVPCHSSFYLPDALSDSLEQYCGQQEISAFVFLMGAFQLLLQSYTRQEDFAIGTPYHGRSRQQFERLVGYFVNMILIRSEMTAESINALLKALQQKVLDGLDHGDYPFQEVARENLAHWGREHSSLIPVVFVFQNWYDQSVLEEAGAASTGLPDYRLIDSIYQEGEFDLALEVIKIDNRYKVLLKYSTALFSDSEIDLFTQRFQQTAKAMLADAEQSPRLISLLTEHERKHIFHSECNHQLPTNTSLSQLFEQQVERTPDNIALRTADTTITYKQLNAQANGLALLLRNAGAGPDKIVPIIAERSLEMMIGIFAILKAGAAYLPISPSTPSNRVHYILQDCAASIVIVTHKRFLQQYGLDASRYHVIDLSEVKVFTPRLANLPCLHHEQNLAYVIYTSGSTGNPKGVMIEHRAAVNRIAWMQAAYPIDEQDIILQKTPFTFDVSVWELFWWSFQGASLHLLPQGEERDPAALARAISQYRISVMHFVPSMLQGFLNYFAPVAEQYDLSRLRQVFTSGEALSAPQVQQFFQRILQNGRVRLINLYGPTEAAIDVTHYECHASNIPDNIPIGRAIDNIQIHIVDKYGRARGVGQSGELCIAGVGLARGYLNNQALTDEKFVPNPFNPGSTMYRTGDLAMWTPEFNIEYLGRVDRQLKVRGVRIEPGEIEAALRGCEGVSDASVLLDPHPDASGTHQLKACVVMEQGKFVHKADIIRQLKRGLPQEFIPAAFMQVDEIPLTAHGKTDTNALIQILNDSRGKSAGRQRSSGPIENLVNGVYKQLLGEEFIDPDANFFEIGGHSLLVVTAARKLSEKLGREVQPTTIFRYPTTSTLSAYLSEQQPVCEKRQKSRNRGRMRRKILETLNS